MARGGCRLRLLYEISGKLADQIRYNYRITSLNKYPVGEIGLNQTKIEGCKGIVKTLCLSIWVQFPRILHPMKWLVLAKNGAPKLNEQSICALNPGSKKLICRKGIDYDYFESCFEVRKSLYDHQHDARRSDHIFNLAQLKDASEEDKTDSGLSQMAKILVHEVQHSKHVHNVVPFRDRSSVDVKSIANGALKISERQPLECRLVSAA
ncbi:hypothetical protein Bca52824_058680 [Brassica carinata]|uniref:Uncharacterized protein n=1 Tax=Brassica carinata TaxID=52824 RepID=A0A8X7QSW7_BRACI|nr:hypothetical protein Bca52824_058680 [Brassica carinata]